MKIVSTLQLQNRQRYFHEHGYKNELVSDIVQRTRTVTPHTVFVKICPFEMFLMKILSVKDIFMKLGINMKQHQMTCRE